MDIDSIACFMREVVRTNKSTGAIAPSGPILARRVAEAARVESAGVIVEFGPGTGVFTEVILQRMRHDADFMAIEINPLFVEATRKRCPGVVVHEDCAQNTRLHLEAAGHKHCDTIVSGLPWTVFDEALQSAVLDAAYDALRPGGRFVTFAYATSPLVPAGHRFFRRMLPARFETVHPEIVVWRNLPPSVVFCAEKA